MSEDPSLHTVTNTGIAATQPQVEVEALSVSPTTSSDHNTVRARLILKACFRMEESNFAFDSSFLTPDAFNDGALKALLDKHPGSKLSIFGHADPSGEDLYNKTLSGRRAQVMFGLLVRDAKQWEDIYFDHDRSIGKDEWGVGSIQVMLSIAGPAKPGNTSGDLDDTTRQALLEFEAGENLPRKGFNAKKEVASETFRRLAGVYMDKICSDSAGTSFRLTREDFLSRGKGKDGKGDFQGCGEFNPLMIFSKDERAFFDKAENKTQRNAENQINRRVMILLFRPSSQVDPKQWPCPTVKEGIEGCHKRFFSDGEQRRSNQEERRTFEESRRDPSKKGTFACRFYERIAFNSPCESGFASGPVFWTTEVPGEKKNDVFLTIKKESGQQIANLDTAKAVVAPDGRHVFDLSRLPADSPLLLELHADNDPIAPIVRLLINDLVSSLSSNDSSGSGKSYSMASGLGAPSQQLDSELIDNGGICPCLPADIRIE